MENTGGRMRKGATIEEEKDHKKEGEIKKFIINLRITELDANKAGIVKKRETYDLINACLDKLDIDEFFEYIVSYVKSQRK